MATILKGQPVADIVLKTVQDEIVRLQSQPTLVVVRVGENPASVIYVNKKAKIAQQVGMNSEVIVLEESASEDELLEIIDDLNLRNDVHGILVQLPLPKHIDSNKVVSAISPFKDVDGLHPENVGWLHMGKPKLIPCTPKGVMKLLHSIDFKFPGKNAVVIGRSNLVGKPIASLLLNADCTVIHCHSKTKDLKKITKEADLVVSAIGKPGFLTKDYFSKGQVVIDVGINKLEDGSMTGDVDFKNVEPIVDYITPVPGGVGVMTTACLMENTLECYKLSY